MGKPTGFMEYPRQAPGLRPPLFASPYVAGTAALIKQKDPTAKTGDIGSILMTSGVNNRDDRGGPPTDPCTRADRLQLGPRASPPSNRCSPRAKSGEPDAGESTERREIRGQAKRAREKAGSGQNKDTGTDRHQTRSTSVCHAEFPRQRLRRRFVRIPPSRNNDCARLPQGMKTRTTLYREAAHRPNRARLQRAD